MVRRLENELITKINHLNLQKKGLYNEIGSLRQIRSETERQMHLSSKNSFVLESGSVIGNIKEKKKTLAIRNDNAVDLEFPSEIVPEFLSGIFTLKSFSLFENSEYVCSEPIRGCGVSWRLKIYPKGNGKSMEGYLSVFLEILEVIFF